MKDDVTITMSLDSALMLLWILRNQHSVIDEYERTKGNPLYFGVRNDI